MAIPVSITIFILLLYSLVMLLLYVGLLSMKSSSVKKPVQREALTVVVPFRDEAENLPALIDDLSRQTYPGNLFSVILVNDHSVDGSAEMVDSRLKGKPGFSCLHLPDGKGGKKAAIATALSVVKTPWIIQVDADCNVSPGFIASHMALLEADPSDLVAGLVTTRGGRNSFLAAFERLDMLGLTGAGAGSYRFGRPMMCSGANLLYSRELYMDTREFDPVEKTASGDDMFMLIGARKLGREISYNTDPEAMVKTGAARDVRSFIQQRIRWGGKSVHYRMADIQGLALLVALSSLGLLLLPLWLFLYPGSAGWLFSAVGVKTGIDFLILYAITSRTGQRETLWWFLPVMVLYYPYMVMVTGGSLLHRSRWKGRSVR
ncbi:MAG: glycosyltransferase [Bacteroidota bacterium]